MKIREYEGVSKPILMMSRKQRKDLKLAIASNTNLSAR